MSMSSPDGTCPSTSAGCFLCDTYCVILDEQDVHLGFPVRRDGTGRGTIYPKESLVSTEPSPECLYCFTLGLYTLRDPYGILGPSWTVRPSSTYETVICARAGRSTDPGRAWKSGRAHDAEMDRSELRCGSSKIDHAIPK